MIKRRGPTNAKAKCLACHGEDEAKIKGGLDLRTQAAMLTTAILP